MKPIYNVHATVLSDATATANDDSSCMIKGYKVKRDFERFS